MPPLRFGIVGTGLIAGVIADAITKSSTANLAAVSSRRLETAAKFVQKYPGAAAIEGTHDLVTRPDVDAVYIAVPTAAKEPIALAAIAADKHVLVDKPFASFASLETITKAAATKGVAFMDATHFVHHPRNAAIRASIADKIGTPRSLHTTFYFPLSDPGNIRFDVNQEPMTALGDMGWYSMRTVVEYLNPAGQVSKVCTIAERDPKIGAIVRAEGLIAFDSGQVSTFDIGYTAGTVLMDLELLGTTGVVRMDDFVLDWTESFAFKNPQLATGYTHRTGMATRNDATFIPTPAAAAQEVLMINAFTTLAATNDVSQRAAHATASLKTQQYLDALWAAANS